MSLGGWGRGTRLMAGDAVLMTFRPDRGPPRQKTLIPHLPYLSTYGIRDIQFWISNLSWPLFW